MTSHMRNSTSDYRQSIESVDLDLENTHDHDNESDTTLATDSFLKPSRPHYSISSHHRAKTQRLSSLMTWMRFSIVVFLQGIIILMLVPISGVWSSGRSPKSMLRTGGPWDISWTETGGDVNGIYIPTKHKYTLLVAEEDKFVPNMTSDVNRMNIRENWNELMPLGSGTVRIPNHEQYPLLGQPVNDDPIRSGPIYEASYTHALHCLYYTLDSYHQLVTSNGTRFGFDGERNDYHAAHCFEYLRMQILCMADMTLEGSGSKVGGGDGQMHMCRDRSEANAWIEERRVDDIQSIVGPAMDTMRR